LQILQISEQELYRIFRGFEFMENVLDSHVRVLLERQRTKDEGDWTVVKNEKKEEKQKKEKMRSVDGRKKIEGDRKNKGEKSEHKKSK
jgi:hypothetical protein